MKPIEVMFLGYLCVVTKEKYDTNHRTAIELTIKETGEPMCTATSNLPGVIMSDNEVAIKNYSENEGILDVLIKAGVISKPDRIINNGCVDIPICRLLI
jgi:hypothetical protein